MSIIKLAVYGAIGYLVYQTFFADMQASRGGDGGSGGSQGGQPRRGGRSQNFGSSLDRTGGITGAGQGRIEETGEAAGTSARHRVGRGVI